MSTPRNIFARISVSIAMLLAIGTAAIAKRHSDPAFSNIKIRNFGKMDDRFYRGAQPDESDYKDLKALGVKTVIDLQDHPTNYEKRDVETLGMRYVNIPMSDSSYPKEESINAFLKLVNSPSTGTMFVHCAGGRHRTGVLGAVYRFNVNHYFHCAFLKRRFSELAFARDAIHGPALDLHSLVAQSYVLLHRNIDHIAPNPNAAAASSTSQKRK